MAFITSHKSPTVKTELDLFAVPPTQTSVESGSIQCYRPVSALTDTSPIEFIIPPSSEEYLDLAHTTLHLNVRIVNILANQNVAPVNNFLHSMFSQVDVFLNQRNICPPTSHYSYRSYLECLLNYGTDAKNTHLQNSMWYKDTAGRMDTIVRQDENDVNVNAGFEKRKRLAEGGRTFELYGHLHCDLFNQNKYLINGVEVAIRLVKEKPTFCLMSDMAASFEITEANLFVRKVRINPSILVAHARTLAICPARYPITRVEIKTVTIATGIQSKTVDNLFIGQLPKRYFSFLKKNSLNKE